MRLEAKQLRMCLLFKMCLRYTDKSKKPPGHWVSKVLGVLNPQGGALWELVIIELPVES